MTLQIALIIYGVVLAALEIINILIGIFGEEFDEQEFMEIAGFCFLWPVFLLFFPFVLVAAVPEFVKWVRKKRAEAKATRVEVSKPLMPQLIEPKRIVGRKVE